MRYLYIHAVSANCPYIHWLKRLLHADLPSTNTPTAFSAIQLADLYVFSNLFFLPKYYYKLYFLQSKPQSDICEYIYI